MNLDTLLTQPGRRYYKLNTALMYIWICRLIRTLRRCVWTLFHSKRDEFQKPAHSFPNGPVRCDNVRLQQLSPYLVYFPTSRQHVGNKKDFLRKASVSSVGSHGALFISTESIFFVKANVRHLAACRLRCSRALLEGPPFRSCGNKSPTQIAHKRKMRQCLSSKWLKSSFTHC